MTKQKKELISHADLIHMLRYSEQTGEFIWRNLDYFQVNVKVGEKTGVLSLRDGDIRITIRGRQYKAHRLAWFYVHGIWPKKFIKHIDAIKTHNWIDNLVEADDSESQHSNKKVKKNKFNLTGVSANNGGFKATLTVRGKQNYLGTFKTAEEAHQAYLKAKKEFHPFSNLIGTEDNTIN